MPKRPIPAVLLISLILIGIIFVNATPFGIAQTATVITSNTTWSKTESPINLVGNVLVKDGATLTINAGVRVNFGNFYIRVENAALTARGTSSEKIYFEGNGELSGISFIGCIPWNEDASTGSIIENAVINFASINCDNAKVKDNLITSNVAFSGSKGVFSNNEVTGDVCMADGTICTASHNVFSGNFETRGSPTVSYNTIRGSLTISGSDTDKPVIAHNTLQGEITQFQACPTLSYNDISGKVSLAGDGAVVRYNTFHDGLSVSYSNSTISNNNFVGGEVGIDIGTIFRNLGVTIKNNVIFGCTEAGIRASNDYQSSYGTITLSISGNVIKECNYGVDLVGVTAKVDGNLFLDNEYGLIGGSSIEHNTFSGNNVGVSSSGNAHYNNFLSNGHGFSLQSPRLWLNNDIDATYNWWGTTDKDAIQQTLFDYKNDFNLGTITFEPFLTAPDPTAPSTSYQPPADSSPEQTATPNPTVNPTQTTPVSPPSLETPTVTPAPAPGGTIVGFEWRDLTILLLGSVVAALVVAVVILLVHRRKS